MLAGRDGRRRDGSVRRHRARAAAAFARRGSAVQAILGQRFIAPILDRLLARKAWEGQFSEQPLPEGRDDNLYRPVPGDQGAHGRFDAQAIDNSAQHWANTHRGAIAAAAATLLGAGLLLSRYKR